MCTNHTCLQLILCNLFLTDIHTIAAIKASENHDNVALGFRDVFDDINYIIANPNKVVNGKNFTTVICLCSDYKVN